MHNEPTAMQEGMESESMEVVEAVDDDQCDFFTLPKQLSFDQIQKNSAAQFLLHLREGRQVSQVALMDVIAGCRQLCNQTIYYLKTEIDQCLSDTPNEAIRRILERDYDPFCEIDTNYLFQKYCVEEYGCVVSYRHSITHAKKMKPFPP